MNEQTDLIQYTKKRSLCRRLLPLLLAMGLLLVGCSGGTEPSEPSSDTGSSTASASSTPAASAPEPEPEPEYVTYAELAEAIREGVNAV